MALEPGVDLPTCGFFKPVRWLIVYRIGKISSMESDLAAIPADKSNFAESLQSRLVLLKSRLEKRLDAVESRLLVTWEQEQITELVKFFPADQLATRDTAALSTRSTGRVTPGFDNSPSKTPEATAAAAPLKGVE